MRNIQYTVIDSKVLCHSGTSVIINSLCTSVHQCRQDHVPWRPKWPFCTW